MRFLIIFLTGVLIFLYGVAPAFSAGPSQFSVDEIEKAITDFYRFSDNPGKNGYSDADIQEMSDALGDVAAVLGPNGFNDLTGHLLSDYRHYPEHRQAIERLIHSMHHSIISELNEQRDHSEITVVIDDIFMVWTAAYVFGFGKGVWKSRGSGLKGIEQFKNIVTHVISEFPKGRKSMAWIVGAGSALGAAQMIYDYLQTKRLDPEKLLANVKVDLISEYSKKATLLLDELKRAENLALSGKGLPTREQVDSIWQPKAEQLEKDVQNLEKNSPELRTDLLPIEEDLLRSKDIIIRLSLKLDLNEFSQVSK